MPFDYSFFIAMFPEFSDTTQYPEVYIGIFWGVAQDFINGNDSCCRMLRGESLKAAIAMMTAHLISLSREQANAPDGPGSVQGGFETSATIDKVSVATLAPPASNMWQWWLAKTPYGQMLAAILYVKSVGGFSVGGLPERTGFRKVGGVFL
jgi:type II secretory pathway component PulM